MGSWLLRVVYGYDLGTDRRAEERGAVAIAAG